MHFSPLKITSRLCFLALSTDLFPMNAKTFDQILFKKLSEKDGFSSEKHQKMAHSHQKSSRETALDPAHLSFLMGQIPQTHNNNPSSIRFNFYKKIQAEIQSRSTAQDKVPPKAKAIKAEKPIEIARKKHVFNTAQLESVAYFKSLGWDLTSDFTLPELKAAYRDLARKLHPDRKGGSHASFIQLKAQFDLLLKLPTLCS